MLAITHKIITDSLQIERTTALLPNDSLERFEASFQLNRNHLINGRSLLSSFEPVEYCLDVARWTNYVELAPDIEAVIRRFWSPGLVKRIPFRPGSSFVPFITLNP
jgi:hypothetical protein